MQTFEEIKKFNPYHDSRGRFSTAGGAASFTIRTRDPKKQHLAEGGIVREKERTKDWKDPSPKKETRVMLSSDKMPGFLTKTKANAKSMTNFCNAINSHEDADPDCVKVLSKLSQDAYTQNGIAPKLSNASNYRIETSVNPFSGKLSGIKAVIPKVEDENDISSVVTNAHELAHFADVTHGGQGKTGTYSSAKNDALKNAIIAGRGANAHVSDETAALFKGAKENCDNACKIGRAKLSERLKEINDKYKPPMTAQKYKEYKKEIKTAADEANREMKKTVRTYNGGAVNSLSDMYDAMCAGAKTMRGTVLVSGHDTHYYASVNNRAAELVANYVAVGSTNPGLLKYFERDYPEVYRELKNHVHRMAEA